MVEDESSSVQVELVLLKPEWLLEDAGVGVIRTVVVCEVPPVGAVELLVFTGPDDTPDELVTELLGCTVTVRVTGTVTIDVIFVVNVPVPVALVGGAVEMLLEELVKIGTDKLPEGEPLPVPAVPGGV